MGNRQLNNANVSLIVQVDDSHDIEMLTGLIDPLMPPEVIFLNSNYDLINYNFQMVQSCKM